jgi:hypothetical protein
MLRADYKYEADWDGDDLYEHAYSDISEYVLESSWSIGRPNAPPERSMAGTLSLTLDNSSGLFSPSNAASPICGLALPNVRIRVSMRSGVAWTVKATCLLQTLDPVVAVPADVSTARLSAWGILSLRQADGEVHVAVASDIATSDALTSVLGAAGFPAASQVDAGQSTISKWWIKLGTKLAEAVQELEDEELGHVCEDEEGRLCFESRAHVFTASRATDVQATYGTGMLNIWNLRQLNPASGIFNSARAQVLTFNKSETVVLATIADVAGRTGGTPPIVPAKVGGVDGKLDYYVDCPSESNPASYAGADSWGTIDLLANTLADGTGNDISGSVTATPTPTGSRLKIHLVNTNTAAAHLVLLRVHGVAIVAGDSAPLGSEDGMSITRYGRREYPYPSKWITNQADGQAKLDHLVACCKDPRARLQFDVMANYDIAHMDEAIARRRGDRIRVAAGAEFGLYIDEEFIVDQVSHSVDRGRMHVMTITCTIAPTLRLAASGTPRSPYTIPEEGAAAIAYPPDLIESYAVTSGLKIISAAVARKYNLGIDEAEFRAKYYAPGAALPERVDLRTSTEGGTFAHDGTTALIITGIDADSLGAQYVFSSAAAGSWFYCWRLHNADGWSNWSDGNDAPSQVIQRATTTIDTTEDSGPPSGWGVTVSNGPVANTIVVKATRPATNGRLLRGWAIQVKNGSTGTWRALDADAGAADTLYNGSAVDHTLSASGKRLTRDTGTGFGTAAAGDLICLDVRGNAFAIAHCQLRRVTAFEGDDASSATWVEVDTQFEPQTLLNLRMKIVSAPWSWTAADGYLGEQSNRGWFDSSSPGAANIAGDAVTKEFTSAPIEIPAAVTNPEARVFFTNNYSTSDDAVTHSTGKSEAAGIEPPNTYADLQDTGIWIPVAGRPSNIVTVTRSGGSVAVAGCKAYNVSDKYPGNLIGVVSKSLLYPDPAAGLMEIRAYYTGYNKPSDITESSSSLGHWGPVLLLCGPYPSLLASAYNPGWLGVGLHQRYSADVTKVKLGSMIPGASTALNTCGPALSSSFEFVPPANASFYIYIQFGDITWSGTGSSLLGLITVGIVTDMPGATWINGTDHISVGNWGFDVPSYAMNQMLGMRIFAGFLIAKSTNVGTATLTKVVTVSGRMHRQDSGSLPPSIQDSGSSYHLYSVTLK